MSAGTPLGTFEAFLRWLAAAPPGTLLNAAQLRDMLTAALEAPDPAADARATTPLEASPRERLWTCPPETRFGVREAAEALGRPVSFVYRHTSLKCPTSNRLPHRRQSGELVFTASELRQWLQAHEEVVSRPPLTLHPKTSA